jgi:hypothetical protein
MFSRKAKTVDDEPCAAGNTQRAAETPAEIVAKVRRGPALQLAERNLSELRRRSGEIQHATQTLVAAKNQRLVPEHAADIDRDLQRLAAEYVTLGAEAVPAFGAVSASRGEFDSRVTAALAPLRHQAVTSALKAAAELRAALELFDSCNSAARRVGSPEIRRPIGILGYLDNLARAFAR